MKHLNTYKLFESDPVKLIDKYYQEADDVRAKFTQDITVIENKFIDDVKDCMYDLTDHSEWLHEEVNDGPFFRYYIFRIPRTKSWTDDSISFDEFVKAVNDSITKLNNHLGVKYEITYFNGQHTIGDLSKFNETAKFYKELFKKFPPRYPIVSFRDITTYKIYIGDQG